MKAFYLILISYFLSASFLIGQSGSYVYTNENGLNSDWIILLDYGSFELVHDEQCYAYSEGSGLFEEAGDSIKLTFFLPALSETSVSKVPGGDEDFHVSIEVLSLLDSNSINNATVFAIDDKGQEYSGKVDSNGKKSFTIPKESGIKYLRVHADNYIACEVDIKEEQETDYLVKIYLRKDPLIDKYYSGPKSVVKTAIRTNKDTILFNGKTYKKVKK